MELYKKGVNVVPTFGYCYYEDSENGAEYIFQLKVKGKDLFDGLMCNVSNFFVEI